MTKTKIVKYNKVVIESGIIFDCDTDFTKYLYSPTITLYNKGWYREHSNKFVVVVRDIMGAPVRENINLFNFKMDAMNFIQQKLKEFKKQ